jgi:chaperonin GroES
MTACATRQTAGGIYLPDQQGKKENEGEVVAVGPGFRTEDGKCLPMDVAIGDTILLPEYGGSMVKIGDEELYLFRNNDILGKYE